MSDPNKASLPRVVIEVSGGVVTEVYASQPVAYLVIDHDNIKAGDRKPNKDDIEEYDFT